MILKRRGRCHSCFCSTSRGSIGLIETTAPSSITVRRTSTVLQDAPVPVDVIGTSDVVNGTLIAFVLAFTASFLQGRRNRDDFAPSEVSDKNTISSSTVTDDDDSLSSENITFDADSWKEISRPESYIFYKQKLREREAKSSSGSPFDSEKAWVLIALLALFVPIFSVEFFFAISRQLICGGDPMNQSELSEFLCSPAMTNFE